MDASAVRAAEEDAPQLHIAAAADGARTAVHEAHELAATPPSEREREQQDGGGGRDEAEDAGDGGGSDGDDEDEHDWHRDLMERFQVACRIVDLKFEIKELIGTYLNPALDPKLQHEAMRRMREEVERKAAERGEDLSLLLAGGGACCETATGGGNDEDVDEQTKKFLRACGFDDRMAEVQKIIVTYFDEDLDDEACAVAIARLWGQLEKELDARANAVSTRKFKL